MEKEKIKPKEESPLVEEAPVLVDADDVPVVRKTAAELKLARTKARVALDKLIRSKGQDRSLGDVNKFLDILVELLEP